MISATSSCSRIVWIATASQTATTTASPRRTIRQATAQAAAGSIIGPTKKRGGRDDAPRSKPLRGPLTQVALQRVHELVDVGPVLLHEALEQLLGVLVGVVHVLAVGLD